MVEETEIEGDIVADQGALVDKTVEFGKVMGGCGRETSGFKIKNNETL